MIRVILKLLSKVTSVRYIVIHLYHSDHGWIRFSEAANLRMKTLWNTSETTGFHLSHHLLFMQIRQIFDNIQPSENKVFLTPNWEFSEISDFQRNFLISNYLLIQSGSKFVLELLNFRQKLVAFISLTIYFSPKSGKYIKLFKLLKIKFSRDQILKIFKKIRFRWEFRK